MKSNVFSQLSEHHKLFVNRYNAFLNRFIQIECENLIGKIKEKTPVDYGILREGWSYRISTEGDNIIITVHNPADYAANVEYGYQQLPGMILKMRHERGKLRFVQFLGRTFAFGRGESSNRQEADDDGNFVIVTRDRFIPGHHMMKDSVDDFMNNLPSRFDKAFEAFSRKTPWIG
jgi:hypothetical protein